MLQNNFFHDIVQNPMFALSSFVIGLIGLILAIIFFIKSRRFKEIRYVSLNRTIVENLTAELDGLEVRYKRVPQERVTVSRFYVWNGGTETILKQDLTELSPLRIIFTKGAQLLDVRIVFSTEKSNQFVFIAPEFPTPDKEEVSVELSFDFLDRLDGATLQIVHTGKTNHEITLEGKIKGAKSIKSIDKLYRRLRPLNVLSGYLGSMPFIDWLNMIIYAAVSIISIVLLIIGFSEWFLFIGAAVGALISVASYWALFGGKLPKQFID
jgi:hypothetical protein